MKIFQAMLCCALCMLIMAGCGNNRARLSAGTENAEDLPRPFSFEEAMQTHGGGLPGVKTEGFRNTGVQEIVDAPGAIDRAKNECTIEYSDTNVGYDAENDMWMVVFFERGTEYEILCGGDQTVYMDGSGITRLIVYGE